MLNPNQITENSDNYSDQISHSDCIEQYSSQPTSGKRSLFQHEYANLDPSTHTKGDTSLSHSYSFYRMGNAGKAKIQHFIDKLKAYDKIKTDKINYIKKELSFKNIDHKFAPEIDKNSRKIALSLSQTFDDRVMHFKRRELNEGSSPSPTSSTNARHYIGPPSCYFKEKAIPLEVHEPTKLETNKNTYVKIQNKITKEFNTVLSQLGIISSITEAQLVSILEQMHLLPQTMNMKDKTEKASQLWKTVKRKSDTSNDIDTNQIEEAILAIITGREDKIFSQFKELAYNRLACKAPRNLNTLRKSFTIDRSTSLFCSNTQKLAEAHRKKCYKGGQDVKTINLYDLYKAQSEVRNITIEQSRQSNDKEISRKCTFKPKITNRKKQTPSNPIDRCQQLFNLSKSKHTNANLTIDVDYSRQSFTFCPSINKSKVTTPSSIVKGIDSAVSRLRNAQREKDKIENYRSLRCNDVVRLSPKLKILCKPCIYIDIDLGNKKQDRLIILENENPERVAKEYAEKNSNRIIRTQQPRQG